MQAAFIDRRTAAMFASISPRTVDRMIARGLPVYRTGPRGKTLIRPADLTAFLVRQSSREQNLNVLVDEMVRDFTKRTPPGATNSTAAVRKEQR